MGSETSERELLSWRLVLALSGGAWMLAYALFRIFRAALVTYAGVGIETPPAFLPLLVLTLSSFMAVGAARYVLHKPVSWTAFTDIKDTGPALGAALGLAAGMFLAGAFGLFLALRLGVLTTSPGSAPPPGYAEPLIYILAWLIPVGVLKGIDYFALLREQGRRVF